MIGTALAFLWSGVTGKPLRQFFDQMRPGAAPVAPPDAAGQAPVDGPPAMRDYVNEVPNPVAGSN